MSTARPISQIRFEALIYRRAPWTHFFTQELEWWTNEDESLLATVSLDLIDHDYCWIILGRDETGVFRGIALNTSLTSLENARDEQNRRMAELSLDNPQVFPQGDNDKRKHEILVPSVPDCDLDPVFRILMTSDGYSPARGIIRELSYAFTDLDGNFKKDFQTTGFAGRLWELYLYAAFYEQKFWIDDAHAIPDFIVEKDTHKGAIEAVTVNPTSGINSPNPRTPEQAVELCRDYMPIKWGSPLFSKLKRRYWEKEQIKEMPFILAIHDFHGEGSMVWSLQALSDYVYGVRCDEQGRDHKVNGHTQGTKVIPSGFFDQPDAENISAIIASNQATLSKFNRMGKAAGFGKPDILIERFGARLDLATRICDRFNLQTEVGVANETWASGLWIFHNPKAKRPVSIEMFPAALNVFFINGQREYLSTQRYHLINSTTLVVIPK